MRLRALLFAWLVAFGAGFFVAPEASLLAPAGFSAAARAEEPAAPEPAPTAEATLPADDAAKQAAAAREAEYYELFRVFADTMDQVERNYVKDISRRELMEAAIRGVLDKLDPYSNYISPEEMSRFKTSVESQFGGIGIQVDMRGGQLVVVSPLVNSPAYKAGLQAGDVIVEINGGSAEGIDLNEAIRRLKGEAGTSVKITVAHANGERHTVEIRREIIQIETVMGDQRNDQDRWDFMLDDDKRIGYIRVTAFSRETARHLQDALQELQKQQLKGLVIDLRFNPGGLLTSAIEISDMFLPSGKIVSTAGRNSPERSWDAHEPGTFQGFPMAILVNRYSASASEIVSAALQDHQRAVVVGERTWGKGSVQNVIELQDGKSALKLTTASYQRPNGHNIHKFPNAKESDEWGVMPNPGFEVKLEDAELSDLVRHRRERDILRVNHWDPDAKSVKPAADVPAEASKPEATKPEASEPAEAAATDAPATTSPFVDRQLQKAIDYLTGELAKAS